MSGFIPLIDLVEICSQGHAHSARSVPRSCYFHEPLVVVPRLFEVSQSFQLGQNDEEDRGSSDSLN